MISMMFIVLYSTPTLPSQLFEYVMRYYYVLLYSYSYTLNAYIVGLWSVIYTDKYLE